MDEALPWNAFGDESDNESDESSLHDYEISPWFSSREDIEKNSPSRRDGIDLELETRLRKSYWTLLDILRKMLKVPQVTIATAIVYCHRFFFRQSHTKNDRLVIATVCLFLAGKVEETPVSLRKLIFAHYGIMHKTDLSGLRRKEVYEQHKELVSSGEKLVLSTLNFELYIQHPYRPLARAIKKYTVEDATAKVAWDFVNDCLRTTLCLQYKPRHIAASALFHALPSYKEVLCQEFDITASQLEDIRGQILELPAKKLIPTSQESIAGSSGGAAVVHQPVSRDMASTSNSPSSDVEAGSSKVNLSQSDDHSAHGGSSPEGTGEENPESAEAGKNQDDQNSDRTIIVETSDDDDDDWIRQLENDLMDENLSEREVEDEELSDELNKTIMQTRTQSSMKVEDPDDNTSVEHTDILDASLSDVDGDLVADSSLSK